MRQRSLLLSIFVLIEIAILIELGRSIGTGEVLLEIVLSALVGWLVIRTITQQTGLRVRLAVWTMEMPGESLLRGFMGCIGGLLLILPGIVTDVLGLLLILPPTQALVVHRFKKVYPRIFAR